MKIKKKKNLIIFIFSLVLVLSLVQLVISHRLATLGEKIRFLEKETSQIEQEIIVLNEQLGGIASLSNVSFQAKDLGFQKATQVWHLTSQIPVALK